MELQRHCKIVNLELQPQPQADTDHSWKAYIKIRSNLLLSCLKFILLIAGISMSLYQTSKLFEAYIYQETDSKMSVRQETELERPRLVVCVNIYKIYLSNFYKKLDRMDIRAAAAIGQDYDTLLYNSISVIYNFSDEGFPFLGWETDLHEIAQNFTNCSKVVGVCNELFHKSSSKSHYCCKYASQFFNTESVCYTVSAITTQTGSGKENVAIYELLYPLTHYDIFYELYLLSANQWISTANQPIAEVKPEEKVTMEVEKVIWVNKNTTKRCSTINQFVGSFCMSLLKNSATRNFCNCEPNLPAWALNISHQRDAALYPERPGTNNSLRPCRLLEGEICASRYADKYRAWFADHQSLCYPTKCRSVRFQDRTVKSSLPPFFSAYSDEQRNDSRQSVVCVFYGSMTVTTISEVYPYSWMSVISSLGGIWSLWLGWSLFHAASFSISLLQKTCE